MQLSDCTDAFMVSPYKDETRGSTEYALVYLCGPVCKSYVAGPASDRAGMEPLEEVELELDVEQCTCG